jgi:hypothetical protein
MNECHVVGPRFIDDSANSGESRALRVLLQAYDCARGLDRDIWQFAVEIEALVRLGVTSCELRKLVALDLVAHAVERSVRRSNGRRFCNMNSLAFDVNSCFVLTDKGEMHVRQSPVAAPFLQVAPASPVRGSELRAVGHTGSKPRWDFELRVLFLENHVVRKFKRPAPHQELIIASFQELEWDRRIDDPIPQEKGMDPKERLHDTIKKLNRGQSNQLIRFYGDGTGRGVCWELQGDIS